MVINYYCTYRYRRARYENSSARGVRVVLTQADREREENIFWHRPGDADQNRRHSAAFRALTTAAAAAATTVITLLPPLRCTHNIIRRCSNNHRSLIPITSHKHRPYPPPATASTPVAYCECYLRTDNGVTTTYLI